MVFHGRLVLLVCCCLMGVVAGCERKPIIVETVVPEPQLRLMRINAAYHTFVDRYGRPPQGEADLLPMLATDGDDEDPAEALPTSSNGEPFVICYGLDPMGDLSWASSTPVLAYEQTADVKGKRWVLTAPGAIRQLSEAEFRLASFPPGHKPVLDQDAEGAP